MGERYGTVVGMSGQSVARRPPPEQTDQFAPLGELTVIDDGTRVLCHLCGAAFALLAGHLRRHRWTPTDCRKAFGLSRTTPLCAPAVSERRRELGLARYANNPRLRAGLGVGQEMARSGELLTLSHAAPTPRQRPDTTTPPGSSAHRTDSTAHR